MTGQPRDEHGRFAASPMSAEQTLLRASRRNMRHVSTVPREIPVGRVLVHNHVRWPGPKTALGLNGFRAWTQPAEGLPPVVRCDCGFASYLPEHYRIDREAVGLMLDGRACLLCGHEDGPMVPIEEWPGRFRCADGCHG